MKGEEIGLRNKRSLVIPLPRTEKPVQTQMFGTWSSIIKRKTRGGGAKIYVAQHSHLTFLPPHYSFEFICFGVTIELLRFSQ